MKNTSFGIRNELRERTQQELAKSAARADALVALVAFLIFASYALAAYLDQLGGVAK